MLTYTQRGHIHEIRLKASNLLVGEFLPDIDGYYYFLPSKHSRYWEGWVLLELGTKLQEINKEWEDILKHYYESDIRV